MIDVNQGRCLFYWGWISWF